ncbi:methyltransferase type 11, partial [candidate division GN15 bacterium]|nr:methyltransferase type 11 [candidate division GN15 bacterium]
MTSQESFNDHTTVVSNDEALEAMLQATDAFAREDETDDSVFYARPRMVEHLDAGARQTVSRLLSGLMIERQPRVLDLMAAVSSHLPPDLNYAEVTGLGLNGEELAANRQLDRRKVHDLNEQPVLPFEDSAFDVVLNT